MSNAITNDDAAAVARLREARTKIKKELAKIVIGQDEIIATPSNNSISVAMS